MNIKRQEGDTLIVNEVQAKKGYIVVDTFTNPAAASATAILNASSMNAGGTVTTFVGQPDMARKLTLVASGATTANVTINGTGVRNEVISETIALNGTTPVTTLRAFKTVTSIVLPTVSSTTLSVGTSAALGLSRKMAQDTYILGTAAGVYEVTRATITYDGTSVSKNTVTFNTAPNGSRTFTAAYISTELYGK